MEMLGQLKQRINRRVVQLEQGWKREEQDLIANNTRLNVNSKLLQKQNLKLTQQNEKLKLRNLTKVNINGGEGEVAVMREKQRKLEGEMEKARLDYIELKSVFDFLKIDV